MQVAELATASHSLIRCISGVTCRFRTGKGMRKAAFIPIIVVVFMAGAAFGFYLLPLSTSQQTYALAFTQQGACSAWGAPWAVTLNGHTTVVEPSNASLPLPNAEIRASPNYQGYSLILFHVSNGVYTYVVSPTDFFSNGTVTINGGDKIVTVYGPFIDCVTQAST